MYDRSEISLQLADRTMDRRMTARIVISFAASAAAMFYSTIATPAASTDVMAQVGSFPTAKDAEAGAARFNTAPLGTVGIEVRSVDLGDKGTWYRLLIGPFPDRAAADQACSTIRGSGGGCFIAPSSDGSIARPVQSASAASANPSPHRYPAASPNHGSGTAGRGTGSRSRGGSRPNPGSAGRKGSSGNRGASKHERKGKPSEHRL